MHGLDPPRRRAGQHRWARRLEDVERPRRGILELVEDGALGIQALGMVGTPLGVGQDMRNIGKGLEPGVGRHGHAALIDVRKSLST